MRTAKVRPHLHRFSSPYFYAVKFKTFTIGGFKLLQSLVEGRRLVSELRYLEAKHWV